MQGHLNAPPRTTGPSSPPAIAPSSSSPKPQRSAEETMALLLDIADGKKTWAEAMALTRQEAFGMAQGAYRLFEFGQHQQGRRIIEALILMNPKAAAFHALLGGMVGRMGDDDGAAKSYAAAIRLEPGNLAARVNRAELRLKQGNIPDALEDLVAATRADPKGTSALGRRAHALARVTSTALRELIAKGRGARPAGAARPAPRPAPGSGPPRR